MPALRTQNKSIYLLGGDDEFSIKEAAVKLADKLAPKKAGEFGVDIVEGEADNQDAALKLIGRFREALNTVGFFGGDKLVWLKNTTLLADNQTTRGEAVKDALADLGEELKRGLPEGVTLLISALGCDQRRSLFKTLSKLGEVQMFNAPEEGKARGDEEIAKFIQQRVREEGKIMTADAFAVFRELVAPDLREIANELTKLVLYVGKRPEISVADVRAICSASRQAVIWELTDTLGARRLPAAMGTLENLLGSGESPMGVLMMLVGQIRLILLARDLAQRKVLIPRDGPGGNFEYAKGFEKLAEHETAHFPRTKDGKLPNAWRLYRCALAAKNFTTSELVRAMEILLEANRQLVSTQIDERLVLAEALAKIALKPRAAA